MEKMNLLRKVLDRRGDAVSYSAVFNHPYHTNEGSRKIMRLIAYFVFSISPISTQPTPLK